MMAEAGQVTFPDHGLVYVTGLNTASGGKFTSIGAGKTALGDAICYTLFEVGQFNNIRQFSTDEEGGTYVCLNCSLGKAALKVESGFKCNELSQSGEGFKFAYDQEVIGRARLGQTRDELLKAIRVSPDVARWTIMVDGDRLRFNDLSQQKLVELLMMSLAQPPWDHFHSKAKETLSNFQSELTAASIKYNQYAESLKTKNDELESAISDKEEAKKEYDSGKALISEMLFNVRQQLASEIASLAKIKDDQESTKKKIKQIEDERASKYHELETKGLGIDSQIGKARESREAVWAILATKTSDANATKTKLDEVQSTPETCSQCGQDWPVKIDPSIVQALKADHKLKIEAKNKASDELEMATRAVRVLEDQRQGIRTQLKALAVSNDIQQLGIKLDELDSEGDEILESKQDLELEIKELERGPSRDKLSRCESIVTERQAQAKAAKEKLEAASATIAEAEVSVNVVKYWTAGFGPTGIPNMILRNAIDPLNAVARRLSSIMTGDTIQVSFDTTKTLATGKDKSELVIKVKNCLGSKKGRQGSKGERGLANLIISETLAEVGQVNRRVGFKWYDEVISGQDPTVRCAILSYLKGMARANGLLVFITDHHSEAVNYSDFVLQAEKTSSGTTYSWLR